MTPTKYSGLYYRLDKYNSKTWVARVFVNNKQYKRVLGKEPQHNIKSALKAKLELEEKLRTGKCITTNKDTIDTLFNKYLEFRKNTISKSWWNNNKLNWNKYLKNEIGHKLPENVLVSDIQKIVNTMLDEGKAPSTAKQIKEITTALYKYLPNLGVYDIKNIGKEVQIPKFDNSRNVELTDEEIQKLFNSIFNYQDIKFRTIFIWLLEGRRKNEVMTIRWEDIDIGSMTYTIKGENSKINKTLTFIFSDATIEALNKYGINKNGYVFPSNKSSIKHIGKTGLDYHWNKIKLETGLKYLRIHDLRHLVGGFGVNNGFGLEVVSKALGHNNQTITQKYSQVRQKSANSVINEFINTYKP